MKQQKSFLLQEILTKQEHLYFALVQAGQMLAIDGYYVSKIIETRKTQDGFYDFELWGYKYPTTSEEIKDLK